MIIPIFIASTLLIFALRTIGNSWTTSIASWVGVMAAIPAVYTLALAAHFIKP